MKDEKPQSREEIICHMNYYDGNQNFIGYFIESKEIGTEEYPFDAVFINVLNYNDPIERVTFRFNAKALRWRKMCKLPGEK